MRIKFDENMSPRIVAAIQALESERSVEIGSVSQDYGSGLADPD